MTATPLEDIHLPREAIAKLAHVHVTDWIDNHKVEVGRDWWTSTLQKYGFEDTLVGETIHRADVFALAVQAAETPSAALTLLWNSLAWGSGRKRRNNKARIASVARDRESVAVQLQQAAWLSRTNPGAAYRLLYPNNRTAIRELGPAFFTKYLYFAGGGAANHPCCILDKNVALALRKTCGWRSLPTKNWIDTGYERYAALLARWARQQRLARFDVIERWLFEEGKRLQDERKRPA
ncbi:hypothetical protein [Mycobacterium simiae]|uniref:Uncharacterized protein n=1 Tax=Mycobacterium simiae TaxID=1784 RepID=A0A1X0Y7U1_MYCSI|nr:hypothetical protein [Mycobacterium simiae]ORJ61163.1 hypothetical protein B5M45_13120 [Mycobacterium simiae]